MAYTTQTNEYRKNAVNGASPVQLIVMLYDGALRFMETGRHAIAHQDYVRQNDQLQRAQRIVMELMACLDLEKGGEIAKNLLSLYDYVLSELVRANMQDDAEAVNHCIRVFSDLRASWSELADQHRAEVARAA